MGGFGSGGHAAGGQKGKSQARRWLDGNAGKRGAKRPERPNEAPPEPVEMPADLPDEHRKIWEELAPLALRARTLTPLTVYRFRLLCKAIAMEQSMAAELLSGEWTTVKVTVDGAGQEHRELKANALCAPHRAMMQRVEAGLAAFRCAPVGKEIVMPVEKVDPFKDLSGAA